MDPTSSWLTGTMPGQSCADVLRAMQHDPKFMFQALMHRAAECLQHRKEEKFVVAALANVLACSFGSMPYLASGSSAFSGSFIDNNATFNGYPSYCSTNDCSNASNI